MGEEHVLEVKRTLSGERQEFVCRLLERREGEAVLLYVLDRAVRVSDLELPQGTRTVAYYWEDRAYNVYHWIHPQGPTLGYYFNVAASTRIGPERVEWRDLGVDLLLVPGGPPRFLDEGELPQDLDARLWAIIWQAKEELRRSHGRLAARLEGRSRALLAARGELPG